jgi:hypothetical protein
VLGAGERAAFRRRGDADARPSGGPRDPREPRLNPHIEDVARQDVARRFALNNFIAFAPDALFPLGGYPNDEDKARDLFARLDQAKTREYMIAAAR